MGVAAHRCSLTPVSGLQDVGFSLFKFGTGHFEPATVCAEDLDHFLRFVEKPPIRLASAPRAFERTFFFSDLAHTGVFACARPLLHGATL